MWSVLLEELGISDDIVDSHVSQIMKTSLWSRTWKAVRQTRIQYEAQLRTASDEDRAKFTHLKMEDVPTWAHEMATNLNLSPLPTLSVVECLPWDMFHQHALMQQQAANPLPDDRERQVIMYFAGWILAKLLCVVLHNKRMSPTAQRNVLALSKSKSIFEHFVVEWRPLIVAGPVFVDMFMLIELALRDIVTKYSIVRSREAVFQKARDSVLHHEDIRTRWLRMLRDKDAEVTEHEAQEALDRMLVYTQKVRNPEVMRMYKLDKHSRNSSTFRAGLASSKAQKAAEDDNTPAPLNKRSANAQARAEARALKMAEAKKVAEEKKKEKAAAREAARIAKEMAMVEKHNRPVNIAGTRRGTRLVRASRAVPECDPMEWCGVPSDALLVDALEQAQGANSALQAQLEKAEVEKRKLAIAVGDLNEAKRHHIDESVG
eukprot:TRINITY_DN11998_c1_g1_i2.p1 TRINITY_DN11998_c1_g1~~TRINITY_DN11998_c1_g1_i2.p1  ORF type:complete len:432 (-),score=77.12 TRINITY_DN11998_c1_g1_i2:74-1369(-)